MDSAHINRIATRVPEHDLHHRYLHYATKRLPERRGRAFGRLARKSQIEHRHAVHPMFDEAGNFAAGSSPSTADRMRLYEEHAPRLASRTVEDLELGEEASAITHLVVTSCTGMYAPGLDFDIIDRCGLDPGIERTVVGFMGCYAAINGLKVAHHIVRSEPEAKVLLVNLELCSLHLQETDDIEQLLTFLVFADGCAASLVSAEPTGVAIDSFRAVRLPDTESLIDWRVRDEGFDMVLSPAVPPTIARGLEAAAPEIFAGLGPDSVDRWAVHPGGRAVLDAVERGLQLGDDALLASRDVLRECGNMSSATVMFVLERVMRDLEAGKSGCAMSFGPGLAAETMLFHGA